MRIKRIEIEGFKSYAQKQVVDNFDAQFNAITGLNGSGKSNILDAICFVLGITNLSQVRASQLVDLVYKQGQAGVTKATVTITFENGEKEKSPLGYEKYDEIIVRRQIIVNGRNTYTINGTAATNSRVADMFRSVGLNVNNPHFLIMQGRITKVLNMKPVEILGMIEEAAGTRMFEAKKQNAIRTIEKKQGKVEEIKQLLKDDILPRVEKLKKDRNNYLEFQKIGRDIEVLERKLIAFDFYNSHIRLGKHSADVEEIGQRQLRLEELISEAKKQIEENQITLADLEQIKKNKDCGEKIDLEENIKRLMGKLTDAEGRRDAVREKKKDQATAVERKQKSIVSDKKDLEKKCLELEKMENESGGDEKMGEEAEKAVTDARNKLETIAKGLMTDEKGNAVSLDAQLTAQRTAHSELETNVKKALMRINQLEPTLQKKKKELNSLKSRNTKEELEKSKLSQDISQIEADINALGFDSAVEPRLREEQKALLAEQERLIDEVDRFEARNQQLKFNYTKPYPNFDSSSVKGLVANLFKIKDMKFATALEVAGGSSLANVVVDSAKIGRELLERGNLARRVTMIPLDKVEGRDLDSRKLQRARTLVGKENVFLAKDLLAYNPELEAAMSFVFGSILITTSDEYAKQVTYDSQVHARSISIDGSDFSPAGVLSGGSRANKTALLIQLNSVMEKSSRIAEIDSVLKRIENELKQLVSLKKNHEQLEMTHQKLLKQYDAVCDSLKHSPVQLLADEIAEIERELPELHNVVESNDVEMKQLKLKIEELEEKKKNEKAFRDREKKQVQKELAAAEKRLAELKSSFENAKASLAALREETTSLQKSIAEDESELEGMKEKLAATEDELKVLEDEVRAAQSAVKKGQQTMQAFSEEMRKKDAEIRKVLEGINAINKSVNEYALKRDSLQKDALEIEKSKKELERRTAHLEKHHKWINDEKRHFGKVGSTYDFTGYTMDIGMKGLDEKKKRKEFLESTINAKAMHMLGTAEEQCRQVELKKQQLEKDKEKLMGVIEKLEEKKRNEILKAHQKVNKDFGNIFSTLLPGTSAKLEPPYGAESALEGLEVKVAFRGKWKDSLGELSGGQRSLVALSLVLAMLKFKPAPLYILDEVDAALDLSHTQNIGAMIKAHFKESQFVIVSLKDGMFNHANVLFKTRFVDGTSTVTRTENRGTWNTVGNGSAAVTDGYRSDEEEPGGKRRKKKN